MSSHSYYDFDLLIEGTETRYRARLLNSPAGQATIDFELPFSALEIENFLLRIGHTRHGVRRLESPKMEAARKFGGSLFKAIFSDAMGANLQESLRVAQEKQVGLRIRLRLAEAPELVDIPWEYLYNPSADRFLVLSRKTPIVRYLDLAGRIRPLEVNPPLHILVMISSPTDHLQLDVVAEEAKLRESLADLVRDGRVTLDTLEDATLSELRRRLRRQEYHLFHFIGHGGFDNQAQDGTLLLEDESERGRPVSGRRLGTLLHDHPSLRLAVLNACEGARASRTDPFAGVAQSLVRQGIPAVIAMQFEITDAAAITFAHEFYDAVVDGYPVDAALAEARKAIFSQGNDVEWGTPVLYMRAPDGKIFEPAGAPAQPGTPRPKHPASRQAETEQLELEGELLDAARHGRTRKIKQLLSKGADVTARDAEDATPLMRAAGGGHATALRLLLAHGADPNAAADGGVTPLIWAIHQGTPPVIAKILLEAGAEVDAQTDDGSTALLVATRRCDVDAVWLLLNYGANPSAANDAGDFPLIALVRCEDEARMQILTKMLEVSKESNSPPLP